MVLGLTGKYCSGKNMAGRVFTGRGWDELDVDCFGHDALIKNTARIVKVFGQDVLSSDGSIDRKRLGSIVFDSKAYLRRLESIIHPEMVDRCRQEINSKNTKTKNAEQNITLVKSENTSSSNKLFLNSSQTWREGEVFVVLI